MEQVLTKSVFAERMGVSPPTVERRELEAIRKGDETFPRRRQLGAGRVGYLESEVDAYLRALPTGPLVERTAAARAERAARVAERAAARAEQAAQQGTRT